MKAIIIDDILEKARKYGVSIQPPASTEELKQCQKDLKERFFPPIPQRYFDFLRSKCNGYAWGIYFFGTKPIPHYNSNNFLEDIVTANEEYFKEGVRLKNCLYIGWGEGVNYFYNTRSGLFEVRSSRGEPEHDNCDYETFKDMFECEENKIR